MSYSWGYSACALSSLGYIFMRIIYIACALSSWGFLHVCSPVAQNPEGEQLIADMQKLLRVPVFAYSDIQGAHITEAGSDESGRYRDNITVIKYLYIKTCLQW